MRKMTICRSNGLLVLPVAALFTVTAPAAAQDSLSTEDGQVHVVRAGETLWTLAEFYLGDPYLWPHIYRLNPQVVEDPHWIFPGERLLLVPPDPVAVTEPPMTDPGDDQATPDDMPPEPVDEGNVDDVSDDQAAPPPPPPPPTTMPQTETVFASNRFRIGSPPDAPMRAESRNPRRIAFYASGFLTEQEEFPWAYIAGATDQTTFGTLTATSAATIHETVAVRAPRNATYQIGDSLLTAHFAREIVGWGNVIRPTGIIVVTAVSGQDVLAEVVTQFDRVSDGQVALPIEPYRSASNATVPIDNGLSGQIIATRDQNTVPNQREVMFIDKGRSDGVGLGDVFEVYIDREDFPGAGGRAVAQITVVHVREQSATVQVTRLSDIGFGGGNDVRLIRRAGS